ncbi:MAG TPA: hypothetical protein VF787_09510 [Thermoanaerobaculia bacterium]
MRWSAWFACLVLSLGVSFPLQSQEQPPEQVFPAAEGTGGLDTLPALTETESSALAAANGEILRRLGRTKPSAGTGVEAIALSRRPTGEYDIVFRYRVDWVEWSYSQVLPASEIEFAANATAAASTIDLAPLAVKIVSRDGAERILKSCNALLSPVVRALEPPYRHRLTNVSWNEEAGAPFLQASARVPGTENDCVRADLNLVTGELMCRDMACAVR